MTVATNADGLLLYVDDVDAWYARAIKAEGAVSMGEPANQPYGARVGTVKDPYDNVWYLASQIAEEPPPQQEATGDEGRTEMPAGPKLFRVMLEVADLAKAVVFYSKLLALAGRVQRGSRAYFDCGPVILAILDPTPGGLEPKPNSADLYFAVGNLEEIHAHARELNCLSDEDVHGSPAGEIGTRPGASGRFMSKTPGQWLVFCGRDDLFTGQ